MLEFLAKGCNIKSFILKVTGVLLFAGSLPLQAQQLTIDRVTQMPNLPAPYLMRDWKQAARGYDNFVFNFNRSGQYLPLIWWLTNTVNYPNQISFGLHTVVGTTFPNSTEAINVLPAVVGASLVGIDKSNQNGNNWVLMSEEYFNRRPEENVYLNHPVGNSGNNWWYDTMPNLFFYQLYDLYPNTGDFAYQFTSVADRWLEAVAVMGGSATPWKVPYMNYHAWQLSGMTPNTSGVPEPEAAGAIAWLLYNAYVETGNADYRIGAEWCMEFLNGWNTNPSYELQLAYGVYTAARMNAELGTTYNIPKLLNWCFNVGALRSWGAIVGTWGGYDVSGLIGEVSGNDYAFIMNTFEQAGALLPLVRYDDRYARAIGKWLLNVANAARLFYPDFLPAKNQDSENWSYQYDPDSYIAHEAMRKSSYGFSPYATGDAVSGGWGLTNLALYGSSHVGILGAVVDTTNVPAILKLDVLKTDYFHDSAYPTFLYYNPYNTDKTVEIDVGSGQHDLYDAVSNSFILSNVSGTVSLTLPADAAVLAVVAPAGGAVSYEMEKMLINGVIADYNSGRSIFNHPPRIKALAVLPTVISAGQTSTFFCSAADRDNDSLSYSWSASGGIMTGQGSQVQWTAPDSVGIYTIKVTADDGKGGRDSAEVNVEVAGTANRPPQISKLKALPRKIDLGMTSRLRCSASDPDSDSLHYHWSAQFGTISDSGAVARWSAPMIEGNYYVTCLVTDGRGGQARDSIGIEVRDFSNAQSGTLVAYYPFNGNANDESGNNHNGVIHGASLVADRFGNPNRAFFFNGVSDYIEVPNNDSLNFQQAISVNFWMNIGAFHAREAYPLSHGSWEKRWKISLTNQRLRWTVKTTAGIKDLDSETVLTTDSSYNVTAVYNGADFEIYLNGELDSFSSWSGLILPADINFTIGQVLPDNSNYNFEGVLDDIRIYNYGLSVQEIHDLYQGTTTTAIQKNRGAEIPATFVLFPNYPNPFNPVTTIKFSLPHQNRVVLKVYDVLGREVASLLDKFLSAGNYSVEWNAINHASGIYYYRLQAGAFRKTQKMLLIR